MPRKQNDGDLYRSLDHITLLEHDCELDERQRVIELLQDELGYLKLELKWRREIARNRRE